jgi:peptidoglycan hydrolase CwlO-like protein
MKKKLLCAALLINVMATGFVVVGCTSFKNLLNPIHAIDGNGEKIAAAWDSADGQCTSGETMYPYQNRPAVPVAPEKPVEPQKPSPPAWVSLSIKVSTPDRYTEESFSSYEKAKKKLDFCTLQMQRNDISPKDGAHAAAVVSSLNNGLAPYEGQQKQYDSQLAWYQASLPKYQQDVAQYNKDIAAYQAKLPEYQARVDAEIKSIQAGINPNAPENWVGYVKGKYLLYQGKVE